MSKLSSAECQVMSAEDEKVKNNIKTLIYLIYLSNPALYKLIQHPKLENAHVKDTLPGMPKHHHCFASDSAR
jgi:hypothetical protein